MLNASILMTMILPAVIKEYTRGSLADIVIDAVGVDAVRPSAGPAGKEAVKNLKEFEKEREQVAPKANYKKPQWRAGDAPSHALRASVSLVAPVGTISIIGVYPPEANVFPIGKAMNKNLTIVMGNCPHKKYVAKLLNIVQAGVIDPTKILSQEMPLIDIVDAYKKFDLREEGWIKVALKT